VLEKTGQGAIVKSLLSRRGSLLDNAPSFLVRQKANIPRGFTAPEIHAEDLSEGESVPVQLSTRVTPLRPGVES